MDRRPPASRPSPIGGTIATEEVFGYSPLTSATVPTTERLAELGPSTLALMHGPADTGDGGRWLRELAGFYAERIASMASAAA